MLRWIKRDGKMVLQEMIESVGDVSKIKFFTWQDVPTHQEPKVDMLVEELAHGFQKANTTKMLD